METLGGIAIAHRHHLWRLSRDRRPARRPAQFFSFITAFLLAYEPAKRLARLNIELNSGLVGVRILFEVLDSAAERAASTTRSRRCASTTPRLEFDDVRFRLSRRRGGAARHVASSPSPAS